MNFNMKIMKNISILLSCCLLLTVSINAQDEYFTYGKSSAKAENEKQLFPVKGDIGIGIDGTPIFNYLGNVFNGTSNNSLNLGDNTLYFRYMITDNTAARLAFSLAQGKNNTSRYVRDDAAWLLDNNSKKELEDMRVTRYHEFHVNAGYQYFRDFWRLRGFFGGDIGYGRDKEKVNYYWGNEMNELNPKPTSSFYIYTDSDLDGKSRYTERDYGVTNFFFAGVFTGAELYILPKICLGAEFGVTYGIAFNSQQYYKYETMVNTVKADYDKAVYPSSKWQYTQSMFPYSYGNIYFMVHF